MTTNYTLTYTAGANGSITGASPQTVAYGGAAPRSQPCRHRTTTSSTGVTASTANPRTDTNVTGRRRRVTANFAARHLHPHLHGRGQRVDHGASPQTVNHGAGGTAVTAVPATGYHFVNWSDASTAIPRTDTNVTGQHERDRQLRHQHLHPHLHRRGGRRLTGTSPQTVAYGAGGTAVTAVPAGGYHFVNWSDASTANPRTDTKVTANVTVTANFAVNAIGYTSIRGIHRYQTAQLISQAMFPGALPAGAGVVVAPGETFPEALCGAPLAAAYGGPVLSPPAIGLENGTRAELQRWRPPYVFVIGLSSSVANAVQAALPSATVDCHQRARNVYDMSRKVAKALETKVGGHDRRHGHHHHRHQLPRCPRGVALACAKLWPILLTDNVAGSALNASAAGYLHRAGHHQGSQGGHLCHPARGGDRGRPTSPAPTATSPTPTWPTGPRPTPVSPSPTSASPPGTSSPTLWPPDRIWRKDNGILLLSPLPGRCRPPSARSSPPTRPRCST